MENIINSRLFNIILLFTIIGEFLLPRLLERYYAGYSSKTMVMSALGSPQSPVRFIYNIWLIWLGVFLAFTSVIYFLATRDKAPVLSVLISLSIGIFATTAGLISGIFSVNETKDVVTISSKIHGAGAAIGFMALLFFPLLNGILLFKGQDFVLGVLNIFSFILALASFVCFVMGDKDKFKNTVLKYEGLWERITLFFIYLPFVFKAVYSLIC